MFYNNNNLRYNNIPFLKSILFSNLNKILIFWSTKINNNNNFSFFKVKNNTCNNKIKIKKNQKFKKSLLTADKEAGHNLTI